MRKTAETLEAQDVRRKSAAEKNAHDFFLEVSQDRYKGVSHGTVRAIVTEMTEEGKEQTKIFVETCVKGGKKI